MAVLTIFIVVGVLLCLFVFGPLAVTAIGNAKGGLNDAQKAELRELRSTMRAIEILAAQNKDVNPELAVQIENEIYNYKTKELN